MVAESLLSPLPMALPAKPTSLAEIRGIIKKMANKKSPGHDLITNKVVKNLPARTIIHLSHIYITIPFDFPIFQPLGNPRLL
jgi:hypothetical protein